MATPISACGTRIDHEDSPKTRTESAITQIDRGGLSTVIEAAASDAAYRNAFQLCEPACAAAE